MILPGLRTFDILTIGDSMLDVFLTLNEASLSCQINRSACLLCVNYADKVPVESVVKVPGAGNASNAAVSAARLGLRTGIVSIVGNDQVGQEILRRWRKLGISTTYARTDKRHETGYSTILNFQTERTILVYHQPRTYTLPRLGRTGWIYYTSLGKGHERLEKQLIHYLDRHPKTRVTFNPGTHQLKRGLSALKPMIARSSVFILNKEEAERLLGPEESIRSLLDGFIDLGAKIVVITDGSEGSYASDGKTVWKCGIFDGKPVERTGAGDAYASAFTYGILQGNAIPEAMRFGTANAWSVVQKIGPQEGLLTRQQLEKALQKFRAIKPKIMK